MLFCFEEPQVPQSPPLPAKQTTLPRLQSPNGYSAQPLPHGTLEGQGHHPATEVECSPIQNSPWKETSLDKPYEKPKKSAESKSVPRSGPFARLLPTVFSYSPWATSVCLISKTSLGQLHSKVLYVTSIQTNVHAHVAVYCELA